MTMKKRWQNTGVEFMKKITAVLMVLMLMCSLTTIALADQAGNTHGNQGNNGQYHQMGDNETGDPDQNETNENTDENETDEDQNETEHEIEIMNNSLGAEIRLLQLEKVILLNLLKGLMAVQVLQGLEINTTQLETILADLRDVLTQVREADPAANDSVQTFVELKNESKALTKQFRDTIRTLLDSETLQGIREQLRNMNSSELHNCSMKIRNRIRQFNRNQLYRLYGIIGEMNTTVINEYLNGNFTLNQTKLQLHKMINQMTKEKQYQIFSEIKEENIKKRIQAHESIENMGRQGRGNGHGKQH